MKPLSFQSDECNQCLVAADWFSRRSPSPYPVGLNVSQPRLPKGKVPPEEEQVSVLVES